MTKKTVFLLCFAMSVMGAAQVSAQADLKPIRCTACPVMTEVPWTYRVGGGTGVFELPSDPNCAATVGNPCPHYINNIRNVTYVSANRFVKQLDLRVDAFDTEDGGDSLKLSRAFLTTTTLQGTPAPGWYAFPVDGTSLESKPGLLDFTTDLSVTRQGFNLGSARVCCGHADNKPVIMSPTTRYSGVLLGTKDTVYYLMFNLGLQQQTLVLNGAPGTDFDLYVRCGALPTGKKFDFRGFSSDSQEYLEIPRYCSSMYVAVNSFRGAGQYNLSMAYHVPASHHSMTAGFDFKATDAQIAKFADTLQGAARRFFGATEGQQIIDRIDLFTNRDCNNCNGAPCDICFRDRIGTAATPICGGGPMKIFQGYFGKPAGVAHELGHRWFCVGDEYVTVGSIPRWQCGHSIMANPFGDQRNFCYTGDHKKDPQPGIPASGLLSAWEQAENAHVTSSQIRSTPDNFNYADFDFNGLAAVVIVH